MIREFMFSIFVIVIVIFGIISDLISNLGEKSMLVQYPCFYCPFSLLVSVYQIYQ